MGKRGDILIIEDDRQIARAVSVRLRSAGFEAPCRHDGLSGLEEARERLPDVIILDLAMPKLNGLAVLAELKQSEVTRDIPIVVVSASAGDITQALNAGAYCFVAKPYDPGTLCETVEAALRQRGGGQTGNGNGSGDRSGPLNLEPSPDAEGYDYWMAAPWSQTPPQAFGY